MEKIFIDTVNSHEAMVQRFKKAAYPVIRNIVDSISSCYEQKGKVILIGNGGSAADCQHIAGELVGRFKLNRVSLPAIALTTDTSVLTCIANDYDYESVFSRQVEAIAEKPDILWAFSTSGSSSNVIKAVEVAKSKDIKIISFTGKTDSPLEHLSDICLCAGTEQTGHAQEIHQLSYHIICKYIDEIYVGDSPAT